MELNALFELKKELKAKDHLSSKEQELLHDLEVLEKTGILDKMSFGLKPHRKPIICPKCGNKL